MHLYINPGYSDAGVAGWTQDHCGLHVHVSLCKRRKINIASKKEVVIIHFKCTFVLVWARYMHHWSIGPDVVLSSPAYCVLCCGLSLIFLDKRSCNATRLPLDWYERQDFLFKCLWKYGRRPAGQHRWTVYWSRVIPHFPHSSCLVWNLLSWTSLLLLSLPPLFKNCSTDIRTEPFRGTRSRRGQIS